LDIVMIVGKTEPNQGLTQKRGSVRMLTYVLPKMIQSEYIPSYSNLKIRQLVHFQSVIKKAVGK